MKKRLRKKLGLKEFAAWDWWINCGFRPSLTEERVDEIKDQFSEVANSHKLRVFRACGIEGCTFILSCIKRYESVTEAQCRLLKNWLQAVPEVTSIDDKGFGHLPFRIQ